MLTKLNIKVNQADLLEAQQTVDLNNFKLSFNKPTKSFFYDPWVIKDEFKNTVWERLLEYLPNDIGEARVIVLQPGACYNSHSDIDDRYHLNIFGNYCFLVDIDSASMYKTVADGEWYYMNAGPRHSAVNFGEQPRAQIVVRKLLSKNILQTPVSIRIDPNGMPTGTARYIFDDTVSIWLNRAVKNGTLMNFAYDLNNGQVTFDVEKSAIDEILKIVPVEFKVDINGY